jgi:hypothetical protein
MSNRANRPGDPAPVTGTYEMVTLTGHKLKCTVECWEGAMLPFISTTTGMNIPIRYVLRD